MEPSQGVGAGRGPRIAVVSPPFLSHAQPLSVLARALAGAGADVLFVSAPAFAPLAEGREDGSGGAVRFVPLTVTRNANTGIARSTRQGAREAERLEEFLASTRRGAVAALLTQSRHRGEDMLADPAQVLSGIGALQERFAPDWYVVDQLSYPVTLALHCLGLPFATFCPGHPTYLPHSPDALFGVPYAWPPHDPPLGGQPRRTAAGRSGQRGGVHATFRGGRSRPCRGAASRACFRSRVTACGGVQLPEVSVAA